MSEGWSRTEAELHKPYLGQMLKEDLLNACFKMLICVWLGMPGATEPRNMFQKIPSVLRRTFWPRFASSSLWKAWWSLALHCRGLLATAFHDLLTAVRQIQLGLFSVFWRRTGNVSCFPHNAVWIIKSPFPLNTRTRHLRLCAQQSTSKVSVGSARVHCISGLSVVIQHLLPKGF